MARIILAHGLLGFGSALPNDPLPYFNGVKPLYESLGHDVRCPGVAPLGSLESRSTALAQQVQGYWPDDGQAIYLVGHSMGGLDCRRLLARHPDLARRVKRLITIATPHFGSPVADAVLRPGFVGLPSPPQPLSQFFAHDAGALADLATRTALQDPDVPGIDYLGVGCDATTADDPSPLFAVTAGLGGFGATPNDGVVALTSASRSGDPDWAWLFQHWLVDHGEAVGWPSSSPQALLDAASQPPGDHLYRYRRLLDFLLK